jgi:hypothetical protein
MTTSQTSRHQVNGASMTTASSNAPQQLLMTSHDTSGHAKALQQKREWCSAAAHQAKLSCNHPHCSIALRQAAASPC